MAETVITRTFVRALKEKHSAIAVADNNKPLIPFIRFKVMEEVGLTVVKRLRLDREREFEASDLIITLHSSFLEAKNAELMAGFRSVTINSDGSVTPNTPEHRQIRPDNVIMTFLTAVRLSERLKNIGNVPDEIKPVVEAKEDLRVLTDKLCGGILIPTPPLVISGADVLWKIFPPYMFHLLGKENNTIFSLRYEQANEFLAEINCSENNY